MNRSTPGLPVHHQLPEFTQTHVHRVSDAIQPSHPLSSPSPPAPNPSQHQGLFQWVNSSHEVFLSTGVSAFSSFLPKNTQADLLQNGLVGSPCSPRDSQESSPTPQFKSITSSALSLLHRPTRTSIHDHRKNHRWYQMLFEPEVTCHLSIQVCSKFTATVLVFPFIVLYRVYFRDLMDFLVAQTVKRLPAMWETWVWSPGQEDLLEKEMATHSSTLARKIPWTEEPVRLPSMGSQRVRHNWATSLSFFQRPESSK